MPHVIILLSTGTVPRYATIVYIKQAPIMKSACVRPHGHIKRHVMLAVPFEDSLNVLHSFQCSSLLVQITKTDYIHQHEK